MPNSGQFKKGQHWRPAQIYWNKDWLSEHYISRRRSASDIAAQFGVTENAITFWLQKHGIKRRSMAEVRRHKHWGATGSTNPMSGKRGVLNPNWRGAYTPLRQQIYSSAEWKEFARAVRKRDKVCKLCGSCSELEIHHIEPFSRAPLLVMFMGNAILLCKPCHRKLRGKESRWRKRLSALIEKGGTKQ